MRRKLVAGNWKMNGLQSARPTLRAMADAFGGTVPDGVDVLICPPATLLKDLAHDAQGTGIAVGGQDCHADDHGAHTGDISAAMLEDAGAAFVIVGHSERRHDHGETSAMVRAKVKAAWAAGLVAIICVGETLADRDAGRADEIVAAQLTQSLPDGASAQNCVIAYEPVWAIGTGRTASNADITAMHSAIRTLLGASSAQNPDAIRILYGGSVKAANADEIFALENVDGGLVGGASLKAADFVPIIRAGILE